MRLFGGLEADRDGRVAALRCQLPGGPSQVPMPVGGLNVLRGGGPEGMRGSTPELLVPLQFVPRLGLTVGLPSKRESGPDMFLYVHRIRATILG